MKEKTRKILVVDDEERNLKLLGAILSNYGYSYETAKDGREALKKVEELLPDLIYLDIMMPEMDGYEVLRRLRSDERFSHIPVILITALADKDSRLKGLDTGANDFLTKPFDPTELLIRTRIMILADQYDALRSIRPYRPSLPHDEVFRIITEGDGRTMP